ncbi:two-component regulator propeller domain-containing protein [uncultured Mucilaginibacter sp.]|uniref:ligand-binding sensor domain-containing protein n=1 Tax=uncultured Mucilaginibacter sp. TaxID=797541 RepID=UPI0025F2DC56|nr:sensor histidine kinase [uncultured Mucilaginibacter sp.]
MYRQLILFLLLNSIMLPVRSQKLDNIKPAYISVKDGLPDATISSICQDEDGFLWIGTNDGLSRYDGVEFKNFYHSKTNPSLPGNDIRALQKLPGHRLLVATTTGLCLFNTRANNFINLLVPASAKMFPFENNFTMVKIDKGNNIWAASQTCLYKLDQKLRVLQVTRGLSEQEIGVAGVLFVESIMPLPDGNVLFRLLHAKRPQYYIYTTADGKIIPLTQKKGFPLAMLDNLNVRDIAFDDKGNAWFVKHLVDSVFFFNSRSGRISRAAFNHMPGKGQIYFNSHISLINNRLAGCTLSDGGLVNWNSDTSAFGNQGLSSNVLLPNAHVICALYDNENNLWIGTINGLYKFTLIANAVTTSALPEYTDDHRGIDLAGIFIVNKKIFLTTTGGGVFYTKQVDEPWRSLFWKNNSELNITWNVRAAGSDTYWIGTQKGVYAWKEDTRQLKLVNWPGNAKLIESDPIVTQFTDKENILWMGLGFGGGLAAYNLQDHSLKIYSKTDKENNLPIRFPVAIEEDEYGDLWMGGVEGRGLVKWERKTGRFSIFPPLYNTDFDNGVINTLYADHKGKMWLGTNSGLVKFDILKHSVEKYDMPGGLSSNTIYSLAADSNYHLWIGTKNGLNCMDLRKARFFSFSGYFQLSDEPVINVKFDAAANKIYFNTRHTFNSLNPDKWLQPLGSPGILITAVTSSGDNLNPATTINLPANDNNISIAYSAVNLVDGPQNKYFYRLNELSKNWIAAGGTRQITFSNLLSGKYTFRVRAQLSDGTLSRNEATLLFSVDTPYYKSWIFIISVIVLVAGVIYLLYLNRIRQLMHLQSIRNSIATDLHDDIGSTLSNINILTELSQATFNEPDKAKNFLKRITEEVNTSNQSLDDIVWSINSLNDSFDEITARMRRYAAEIFEGANIAYHVHVDEKLSHKKLHMEKRKDIYLVFKEAVNNVYKHAEASNVEIKMKTNQHFFEMIISDNGRGFDTAKPSVRNGLKNMKLRASKWRGSLTVLSVINKGTVVTIIVPIT